MLFENNDNYFDLVNMYPSLINQNDNDDMKFFRGNMFDNEYEPYKDYKVTMYNPKNRKESKLMEIMKYSFGVNDYNLYLDLHPNDKSMLDKYKKWNEKLMKLCSEYEKEFGPLSINSSDYSTFKWIDSPWPWDREDGKYV